MIVKIHLTGYKY
nr:unnamed protein product [Callosobruchus analis]